MKKILAVGWIDPVSIGNNCIKIWVYKYRSKGDIKVHIIRAEVPNEKKRKIQGR